MKKFQIYLFCTLLLAANASAADTAPINQATAQVNGAAAMARGSDKSIDDCTRHAMSAVMNVASLNFPTAMKEGYHALDNYLNSSKMDKIEAQNKSLQQSLGSVSGGDASGTLGSSGSSASGANASGVSGRTVGERDPSFLYQGETAKVAAEFERRTGMKRETFFSQMASGLDSKLSFSDPNLIPKIEARYERFMSAIPNEDFKKGIRTAEALIPNGGKQFGVKTVSKYVAEAFRSDPKAPMVAKALAAPQATPASSVEKPFVEASVEEAARAPSAIESEAPSAFAKVDTLANGKRPLIGINSDSGLNDYFAGTSAVATAEDSIFSLVSKRYRILSPSLQGIQ